MSLLFGVFTTALDGRRPSPSTIAQQKIEDFSEFRTFGCGVWVCPPGRRKAKF